LSWIRQLSFVFFYRSYCIVWFIYLRIRYPKKYEEARSYHPRRKHELILHAQHISSARSYTCQYYILVIFVEKVMAKKETTSPSPPSKATCALTFLLHPRKTHRSIRSSFRTNKENLENLLQPDLSRIFPQKEGRFASDHRKSGIRMRE
jgi:hypothetical protein